MKPGRSRTALCPHPSLTAAGGIAALFFGLWGGTSDLQAAPQVIVLTPHVDAIRYEFGRGFARWHQERFGELAQVEWRDVGGTSDALRFVQSEFSKKPDGIGIDCFFGGGQEPFLLLSDKHWALPYRPAPDILAGIPQNFNGVDVYDSAFTWFGAALSSFGILQNTRVQRMVGLAPAQRWEDLAQPQLCGWVGAGDPRNSGTMTVMFEAFLQFYGWERGWQILTQLGGNIRKFDRISTATAKDVTVGETAYGLALDFYGFTQVAVGGRTNLSFVLPQDFTSVNADGLAILKGAPHLATAQRFVDFVLSEAGQKLWFLPRAHPEGPQRYSIERMSVRPDFYARYRGVSNIEFSPFELKQDFRYNPKLARVRREVLPALVGALLVDTHAELQAAWRAVIRRGLQPSDLTELGRVPVTEAEAMQLATNAWKSPAFRNLKKIEWQSWAQDKYRRLIEGPSGSDGPRPGAPTARFGTTPHFRTTHSVEARSARLRRAVFGVPPNASSLQSPARRLVPRKFEVEVIAETVTTPSGRVPSPKNCIVRAKPSF
jgi:ABC-type Fe3+ transport system substrate-binding protein